MTAAHNLHPIHVFQPLAFEAGNVLCAAAVHHARLHRALCMTIGHTDSFTVWINTGPGRFFVRAEKSTRVFLICVPVGKTQNMGEVIFVKLSIRCRARTRAHGRQKGVHDCARLR